MAVNNFAPAEYGGYVLGANSGGGGGGLSNFDEFLQMSGTAEVEMTVNFPEGTQNTTITGVDIYIDVGTMDEYYEFSYNLRIEYLIVPDSNTFTVVVPICDSENLSNTTLYLDQMFLRTSGGFYRFDSSSAQTTGGVEKNENVAGRVFITGDGTLSINVNLE